MTFWHNLKSRLDSQSYVSSAAPIQRSLYWIPIFTIRIAVADLRGRPPPTDQNFLDFMQFFGKFDKIVCWRPLEGWAPLLRGILDPPLHSFHFADLDGRYILANFLYSTPEFMQCIISPRDIHVKRSCYLPKPVLVYFCLLKVFNCRDSFCGVAHIKKNL